MSTLKLVLLTTLTIMSLDLRELQFIGKCNMVYEIYIIFVKLKFAYLDMIVPFTEAI